MAAVEFALLAPFLVLLLLATADLGLWLRGHLRLGRAVNQLGNIVTQQKSLDADGVAALFQAGQRMAAPLDVTGPQGATILSLVGGTGTANLMQWQRRVGVAEFTSRFGTPGQAVVLPGQGLLPSGQTVIVAEMFSKGQAWVLSARLLGSTGPDSITALAIYRPRFATLAATP